MSCCARQTRRDKAHLLAVQHLAHGLGTNRIVLVWIWAGLGELMGIEPDWCDHGEEWLGSCFASWLVEFCRPDDLYIPQAEIQSRSTEAGENDRPGISIIQ